MMRVAKAAIPSSPAAACAAALFAVGWPYEGDCGPDAPACWRQRDDAFWAGIEQAWQQGLRPAGGSSGGAGSAGAASSAQPRPRLQLPFFSNFCQGSGRALFQAGRVLSDQPWYNLSLQAPQPMLAVKLLGEPAGGGSMSSGETAGAGAGKGGDGGVSDSAAVQTQHCPVRTSVCAERAFSGGCSLCISGALRPGERATVRLFEPGVALPAKGVVVRLTASLAGIVGLHLALHLAPAGSTTAGDDAAAGVGSSAAQAGGAGLITLTPLFSAAHGQAAETAEAAWAGDAALATASPGRHTIATLSATASRRAAAHAAQAGGAGGDASALAATPDWHTFQFSLVAGMLPDTGGTVLLAAVDLLLEGISAGSLQGSTGPSSFTAHLGEGGLQSGFPQPWFEGACP